MGKLQKYYSIYLFIYLFLKSKRVYNNLKKDMYRRIPLGYMERSIFRVTFPPVKFFV